MSPIGILTTEAIAGIPRDLICSICMDPSVNWKTACDDSHSFCGECLESHVNTCRANGKDPFCPVCKGEVVYGANGQFKPNRSLNNLTNDHRVECPNKCGVTTVLAHLPLHVEKNCPEAITQCPMHVHGCLFKSNRMGVQEHMKNESHTNFAMPYITTCFTELKSQNDALSNEVKALTCKLYSAIAGIVALNQKIGTLVAHGAVSDKKIEDLTNLIEDEEYGLKAVAKKVEGATKKRASPGHGQSARAQREKRQVVGLAAEVERLRALVPPGEDKETEKKGDKQAASMAAASLLWWCCTG